MSMIYECPSCHTPQAAGQTSCPQCGADFEGPVPDDAVVPEPAAATANAVEEVRPSPSFSTTPAPEIVPPAATPPFQAPPTPIPTYQAPPPYTAPPVYHAAPQKLGGSLPKPLLIGIPVVLVLVLGAVFFTRNLDSGSDTTSTPSAPVSAPVTSPSAPIPTPSPASPPVTLSGGSASSANESSGAKFLVGRWQAKSSDFYQFNDNSTGSRGTITGKQAKEAFVWVLAQNDLVLYTDKQEKLVFSPGSDEDSMFLRGEDGHYVEYRRAKTNT